MSYVIRLVEQHGMVDKLIDLYRMAFDVPISRPPWEWLFLHSPLGLFEHNIVAAFEGEKLIGARPLVFHKLWVKDEKVKAAQPAGTMVYPDHRRKGIFSRMNELAINYFKEKGYALFFNYPRPASREGYFKQGWKLISTRWVF